MTRNTPHGPIYGTERQKRVEAQIEASRMAREICAPEWSINPRSVKYGSAPVDDPENASAFVERNKPGKARKKVRTRPVDKDQPYCHQANWLRERRKHDGDACLFLPKANAGFTSHVRFNFRRVAASRAMCILAHGTPPFYGAMALHSCGNGHLSCVNPKHLRWGTAKDNAKDRVLHNSKQVQPLPNDPQSPLPKVAAIELGVTAESIRAARKWPIAPPKGIANGTFCTWENRTWQRSAKAAKAAARNTD